LNATLWNKLTLTEQLGHIGSEITRARVWQEKGEDESSQNALNRAILLLELSMNNTLPRLKLAEVSRLKELVLDLINNTGARQYGININDIEKYCNDFALISGKG
jgi:hypothetical protein